MTPVDYDLGTPNLRLEADGPILWCIINRPHARNAITPAMYWGFKKAVHFVGKSDKYKALILTGTGDVFAPGGDLGGRYDEGENRVPEGFAYETLPFVTIRESRAPIISAVNGICQAGGLLIAMLCDVMVMSERATFRVPEILRGIVDSNYACLLPAFVGMANARDLILSARRFDATEAYRIGLGSRLVPHDLLHSAATEAAHQLLMAAPECRAHLKRMLNLQSPPIDYETMFTSLAHSSEPREGMAAFMEKRPPAWVPEALRTGERL